MNDEKKVSVKNIADLQNWAKGKELFLPDLQRDYVWGKEQWRRLWEDVVNILNTLQTGDGNDLCPQHFTGIITLKRAESEHKYHVLDGQQRLTTLSVLADYLNYACGNENVTPFLGFFHSKIDFVQDALNSDAETRYLEIYRYFMDCHYDMDYNYADILLDIVLNRLFFMVKITQEDAHEVFENLNATGKNLEFSDLILNHLMEQEEENASEVKVAWNSLMKKVYEVEVVHDQDDEEENEEENQVVSEPLKLKKFLNAINSLTLSENEAVAESIVGFDTMVERLGKMEFDVYQNKAETPLDIIEALDRWEGLYRVVVAPQKWEIEWAKKIYAKELYYLSLWNVTPYIPVIMRILNRNVYLKEHDRKYYSDSVVKNLFKAILCSVVHTRIILNRKHSENKNFEKKIKVADYILDAYRDIEIKKNFGDKESELIHIFSELKGISKEVYENAEMAIKGYQYNSSGSKFLLALYADEKDENDSLIRSMEQIEKAHVEHMVPQNLEDGKFEDYGYDVGSIGLLENLILLSASTNREISNKKPEDKYECWKKDAFGNLFVKDAELKKTQELRVNQTKKTETVIEKFKEYFYTSNDFDSKAETFTFAKKIVRNNRTEAIVPCASRELLSGNVQQRYLRINKNMFEEHPKKVDDKAMRFFFNGEENAGYNAFELIEAFIKGISGGNISCFEEWLKKCEESIDVCGKVNGSNEVEADGRRFAYSQKMIHSTAFKQSDIYQKVMGRAMTKELHVFENVCICNDFNIHAIIDTLEKVYAHYENRSAFSLWVEIQRKRPVLVDGVLLQTGYINLGDNDKYIKWLKAQDEYKGKFSSDGASEVCARKASAIGSYFRCEEKNLNELDEYKFYIPEYQRRYVWDEKNWEELCARLKKGKVYLGTIVLREEGDMYSIVDGQQRLTTLAMLNKVLGQKGVQQLVEKRSKEIERIGKFVANKYSDLKEIECYFDVIYVSGPNVYQYDVFSSINSTGKKLTIEEKVKNYLMMRYSEEAKKNSKKIVWIANSEGFAKALCECESGEFCKSTEIYHTFKRVIEEKDYGIEDIEKFATVFAFVKGTQNLELFKKEKRNIPIWIKLLRELEVTTADALLLNQCMRILDSGDAVATQYTRVEELVQKVCIIFWLLYVMDRSGNGKKSANSNFLKCLNEVNEKKFVSQIVSSTADLPYWNSEGDVSENIWEQYVLTLPIYEIGKATIKRFVLLMFEYMMIDGKEYTQDDWEKNVYSQSQLDIEHIFPVSEKNWPKDIERTELIPSPQLNYLVNVMLLETKINKRIKDKMLCDDGNGKMTGYSKSSVFMARMFKKYDGEVYDMRIAKQRMGELKERIVGSGNFKLLLDCVNEKL